MTDIDLIQESPPTRIDQKATFKGIKLRGPNLGEKTTAFCSFLEKLSQPVKFHTYLSFLLIQTHLVSHM
jgi:hypothetical protein